MDWCIYQLSEGVDCLYFRVDPTVKIEDQFPPKFWHVSSTIHDVKIQIAAD